tara:strand:+ start:5911 stop:7152 length:1242 start_codon:yes stop_codon:yes gene_type:complete
MTKKKDIIIIGGGLYGCILAILASKKKYNVKIIENSNDILSSLKPIKIGKYLVNNGFHGLDYPRCKNLISFLQSSGIRLNKIPMKKILIYGKQIVNYNDYFHQYPKVLQKIFVKKNLKNYSNQSFNFFFNKKYLKKIYKNASRYSDNYKIAENFFLPYFLPASTRHKSSDEGDIFRDNFRKNQKNTFYFIPTKGIFYTIKQKIKKLLRNNQIKVFTNSKILIENNKDLKIIEKSGNKIFYDKKKAKIFFCISSIFFLKHSSTNLLNKIKNSKRKFYTGLFKIKKSKKINFSEALLLNDKIYYVNRITQNFCIKDKNYNFFQIEILVKKFKNIISKKKELKNELSKIFNSEINIIDLKLSREVFHPNSQWFYAAEKSSKNFTKKLSTKLYTRYNFYPVNMNKAWLWANEDIKRL